MMIDELLSSYIVRRMGGDSKPVRRPTALAEDRRALKGRGRGRGRNIEILLAFWDLELDLDLDLRGGCRVSGAALVRVCRFALRRRNPELGRVWHLIWTGCSEGDGECSGASIRSLG